MANTKLKWKAEHSTDFTKEYDILETVLCTYGVKEENISDFLLPSKRFINNPFLMKNMDKAVELVRKNIKNDKKIFIKVDCDCDGVSSAVTLITFLKAINNNIEISWAQSNEKQHGLFYSDISQSTKDEYGIIIVPDASMLIKDALQIKKNFSADILVLDHHLVEDEYLDTRTGQWVSKDEAQLICETEQNVITTDRYTNYCLAVNCTDGQYPNPSLSGGGVVQKFIEAYLDKYGYEDDLSEDLADECLEWVSFSLISDSMDLINLENRYYVLQGLKPYNQKNLFLKELVERKSEDMKYGRTISSMGWNISPLINACVRYGSPDEQKDMFRAALGEYEDREYQPRRRYKDDPKPPKEIHSLQKFSARVCENIKNRQDSEVRRFLDSIFLQIEQKKLDKNSILFVDGTKVLTKSTITGLVANKLASKYFRPVVLYKERDVDHFGGSMRGYDKGNVSDTKTLLESIGIECHGHANASGCSFPKNKLDEIIKKGNEVLPIESLCTVHQVGWEIEAENLRKEYVTDVAKNYEVWGNNVPEPTFAIKNLRINASKILAYGNNNNFIRFTYNGISFVKKYCNATDFDEMVLKSRNDFGANKKDLVMNMIVQFQLNKYEDQVNPEVKILFYDSAEDISNKESKKTAQNKTNSNNEITNNDIEVKNVKTDKKIDDEDFDW